MSKLKEGAAITFEDIERGYLKSLGRGLQPLDRIISYNAARLLKKIHHKLPDWDSWCTSEEIYYKAHTMGIKEDE